MTHTQRICNLHSHTVPRGQGLSADQSERGLRNRETFPFSAVLPRDPETVGLQTTFRNHLYVGQPGGGRLCQSLTLSRKLLTMEFTPFLCVYYLPPGCNPKSLFWPGDVALKLSSLLKFPNAFSSSAHCLNPSSLSRLLAPN